MNIASAVAFDTGGTRVQCPTRCRRLGADAFEPVEHRFPDKPRYCEPFEQMVRAGLLPGFIEIYIERGLKLRLSRI